MLAGVSVAGTVVHFAEAVKLLGVSRLTEYVPACERQEDEKTSCDSVKKFV